jgi:hypothetical protein
LVTIVVPVAEKGAVLFKAAMGLRARDHGKRAATDTTKDMEDDSITAVDNP